MNSKSSSYAYYDDEPSEATADREEVGVGGLPSESQLVLLCLDYLRDLRRSYPHPSDLLLAEGLDGDYISVAIWALSRSFVRPAHLVHRDAAASAAAADPLFVPPGNDPFFDSTLSAAANEYENSNLTSRHHHKNKKTHPSQQQITTSASAGSATTTTSSTCSKISSKITIPDLNTINNEILYLKNPHKQQRQQQHQHYGRTSVVTGHHHHTQRQQEEKLDGADAGGGGSSSNGSNDVGNNGVNEDPSTWYVYDDTHISNSHRFYHLNGLASGPTSSGPLTLGEITAAGLAGLGARSRCDAEREMVQSSLFEQFVSAVRAKGFFRDVEQEEIGAREEEEDENINGRKGRGGIRGESGDDGEEIDEIKRQRATAAYEARYRKVVAKFRTKLAAKAEQHANAGTSVGGGSVTGSSPGSVGGGSIAVVASRGPPLSGNLLAMSAAERHRQRRRRRAEQARLKRLGMDLQQADGVSGGGSGETELYTSPEKFLSADSEETEETSPGGETLAVTVVSQATRKLSSGQNYTPHRGTSAQSSVHSSTISVSSSHNQIDLDEAERLKASGNAYMQKKEYAKAAEAYTTALKLSPAGPNSHVYFSNRAAALLSMKKFHDAILDSERSLALKPDYGKAHARLGLAHFLLGNYRQAIEAYMVSLKYEPDNKSSRGYLEKAKKKLAQQAEERRSWDSESENRFGGDDAGSSEVASTNDSTGRQQQHHQRHQISDDKSRGDESSSRRVQYRRGDNKSRDNNDALSVASSAVDDQAERQRIIDQKEADKKKSAGNTHMAGREYQLAIEAYSAAIRLCPFGPNSHVYFSNRAAALCYLERYEEAELDSERALALKPDYGKAHARLGLSRFFLGDYEGAVEAYTAALKFDPDNLASKSYLAKAKQKMEEVMDGGRNVDDGSTVGGDDGDSTVGGGEDTMTGREGGAVPPPPPPPGYPPKSPQRRRNAGSSSGSSVGSRSSSDRKSGSRRTGGGGDGSPTPQDVLAAMERIARDARSGKDVTRALAAMMENPAMMRVAKRIMDDPEMQRMARNGMVDPSMMEAMLDATSSKVHRKSY